MSYLLRRGDIWCFRRRVPRVLVPRLGRAEIWLSLSTVSKPIARYRSSLAYALTDDIFAMAHEDQLDDADLRVIADHYLKHLGLWSKITALKPGELRKYILPDILNPLIVPHRRGQRVGVHVKAYKAALQRTDLFQVLSASGYPTSEKAMQQVRDEVQAVAQNLVDEFRAKTFPTQAAPISTFIETYADELTEGDQWTNHTRSQNVNSLKLMIRIIGDKAAGTVTRNDAKLLHNALQRVPKNYGKTPSHFQTAIEKILKEEPGDETLSVGTLDRHWITVTAFFRWLNRQDDVEPMDIDRVLGGFIWSKGVPKEQKRMPWDMKALNKLFSSPIWVGYRPKKHKDHWRWESGETITRDHYYWLPLLALHTGARLEEISQLRREDIAVDDGVPTIRITNEHDEQQIKTDASERKIPIHSALIKCGFLKYAESINNDWIFPEMRSGGRDDKRGHYYSKDFTQYRREIDVYRPLMDFHSFRHNAITALIRSKADRAAISQIAGHSTDEIKEIAKASGVTFDARPAPTAMTMRYFGGFTPQALSDAIEHLTYPELNLAHLYV